MCQPTNSQCPSRVDSLQLLREARDLASAARVAWAMAAAASTAPPMHPPTSPRATLLATPSVAGISDLPQFRVVTLTERQSFLLLIKCLLKYLQKVNEHGLRLRVKAIVAESVKRNRNGDAQFSPLSDVIELLLRKCVGEVHWARAKLCVEVLCEKRHWRIASQAVVGPGSAANGVASTVAAV